MLKPSRSDLLPGSPVCGERIRKLVILGDCGEIIDCSQGSPVEGVGKSLVLSRFWLHGGRSGEVSSLKVDSRKVCNSRANSGREISDRFLDLCRVVVGFELINPCYPTERIGQVIREYEGNQGLLEEVDMNRTKGIDSSLKLLVLYKEEQRLAHD